MYLNLKQQKIVKTIAYAIQLTLIALVIIFGCLSTHRGKTIKNQKAQIEYLEYKYDSLNNSAKDTYILSLRELCDSIIANKPTE